MNPPYQIFVTHSQPLAETTYSTTQTPFVSPDLNRRTNPAATLKSVQSIFAFAVPQPAPTSPAPAHANLSSLGVNPDYHPRVRAVIKDFVKDLPRAADFKHKILVDSGGLDERAIAHRAGLGFYGRHGLIISPTYGTRFNIGLLLTNIPLAEAAGMVPPPATKAQSCPPGCHRCITTCPNQALSPGQPLHWARCISYLTQKKDLSHAEKDLLHGQLYGCDICQNICPFNHFSTGTYINPETWVTLSDEAFLSTYGHTAMLWQGTEILKRNAQLAISLTTQNEQDKISIAP